MEELKKALIDGDKEKASSIVWDMQQNVEHIMYYEETRENLKSDYVSKVLEAIIRTGAKFKDFDVYGNIAYLRQSTKIDEKEFSKIVFDLSGKVKKENTNAEDL